MAAAQGVGSPVIDLNTTGTFQMNSRTLSVPLELTTNFRLLYLLSLYGGLGFDWQLGGGSDMSVDLDGTMVGVTPAAGGSRPCGSTWGRRRSTPPIPPTPAPGGCAGCWGCR
jgi:hypothetical protein